MFGVNAPCSLFFACLQTLGLLVLLCTTWLQRDVTPALLYTSPTVIAGVSVSVVVLLVAIVTVVLVGLVVYWTRRTITIRKIPLDLPPRGMLHHCIGDSEAEHWEGLYSQEYVCMRCYDVTTGE